MAKNYSSRPAGMVAVRLDLDAARHDQLRMLAARDRVPMSRYVRSIVEAHLDSPEHVAGKQRSRPKKSLPDC